MHQFIQRHAKNILGVLSGFDRLRLRGTIRQLVYSEGMCWFLRCADVLFKDFGSYSTGVSDRVKKAAVKLAERYDRPQLYLPGGGDKEAIARQWQKERPVERGLIGVLSAVENCRSYQVIRNRETKHIDLRNAQRKCLHYYFYFNHAKFGFMHARLQTWFPFDLQLCLNGREWLCRDLDRLQIGYRRRENCLIEIENPRRAQALCDRQCRLDWVSELDKIARVVHPLRAELARACPLDYYWTIDQSEWATDVMFRSPQALAELTPSLVDYALKHFRSRDVMRFLGRKVPTTGVYGHFQGQVISDLKHRPEGIRVKHSVDNNSIKLYDKQGSVLRTETTLNEPYDMKVYRAKEGDEGGKKEWRILRKGVADTHRRAEVCQAANERYLDALAAASDTTALAELTQPLCQRVKFAGRYLRGLNPLAKDDAALLEAVNCGAFTINGFRNRDLQSLLYHSQPRDTAEKRRRSGAVTRQIRLLRAHGLIRKIPRTHRYQVTTNGRLAISAVLAARQANTQTLTAA